MFLCFFTTAPSSKMCLNLLCTFTESTRLSCVYDIDKLKDHYKNSQRILTSCIYYMVAKIGNFILKDVDLLPLQGLTWQTDQVINT